MASLLLSVSQAVHYFDQADSTDHSYVKDIQQKICENAAAEYSW